MASNASVIPPIAKLKGRKNYESWKFAVRAYFKLEKLWNCVEKTQVEDAKELEKMEEYVAKNDEKAYSKLVLLIESDLYYHLENANTAAELWTKLKTVFSDNGLTTRVGLLRSLLSTRLVECASVSEYVTKIITIAQKLRNIGMSISDEWLGSILLAGLPAEYEPMIMGIESSGMTICVDGIKAKLLQDVRNFSSVSGDHALFGKSKKRNGKPNVNLKCFNCDKTGHFSRHCPEKRKLKEGKPERCKAAESLICTSYLAKNHKSENWFIDSGASSHMTVNKNLLKNVSASNCREVVVANNSRMKIECSGDLNMRVSSNGNTADLTVNNVQYVPNLCTNLLSVSAMTKHGKSVVFNEKGAKIFNKKNEVVATASLVENMYKLDGKVETVFFGKNKCAQQELWHRRLGHIGFENLKKMRDGTVNGVVFSLQKYDQCANCLKGKHSRFTFGNNGSRAGDLLELVHSDVCGPIKIASNGGARYILTFIDDFSRKVFIYFLKFKSEVHQKFVEFKNFVENQTGKRIKALRSDNGTEYCNYYMNEIFRSSGIMHQLTAPYTPQQNGLAERMNRTLVEKARCMLIESKLDLSFWAEAISTAAFIINRSPCSGLSDKTPYEVWSSKKPDLSFMRVFGCKAMVHVPENKRSKFDAKSEECFFVGYSEHSKAYRLFNFSTGKVLVSRDVVFFEDEFRSEAEALCDYSTVLLDFSTNPTELAVDEEESVDHTDATDESNETINESILSKSFEDQKSSKNDSLTSTADESSDTWEPPYPIAINDEINLRRSERAAQLPAVNYGESEISFCISLSEEPSSVREAMQRPDAEEWRKAMRDELSSLQENKTWELVKLPPGRKPLKSKWVFKLKRDANDKIVRYKARLVVKGCFQKPGIDYNETYSPVVRHTSIRYLLALATKQNLDIVQMDAVTAFLQGDLEEEIYMFQPDGFSNEGEMVCRLKKSIYGLKQASRIWNLKLDATLVSFGLHRSKVDPCVYYKIDGDKNLFVAVYVDDILIFSNNPQTTKTLRCELMTRFKMKDIGEVSTVLGMRVQRDRRSGTISIDQTSYINEILRRFDMFECNPSPTPLDHNQKLSNEMSPKNDAERNEMSSVPYQEAVGSIMYVAQVTRPDVCFAVNAVSRFNQNPGKPHWCAVKRILRYLKGTANMKLVFGNNGDPSLLGYCDADWAGDIDKRRSTTGYAYIYQGAAISWNSRIQPTVAISTTEAEYMSLSAALQEAMWLRQLRAELESTSEPLVINCDNKSAIDLASTSSYHSRSKHIDVRHHFIRDLVASRTVTISYKKTDEMIADIFTKAIVPVKHNLFSRLCGLKLN